MYIYIYCIYISHKKIQYLPPPQRAASVVCALGRNCPDDRFWAGFGGVSAQTSSSSSSPGSQTSLAGRLLGKQTSLCLLPLSWIVFFSSFFFLFFLPLFFCISVF